MMPNDGFMVDLVPQHIIDDRDYVGAGCALRTMPG
jgi:hypothetical protein